MSSMRRVLAPVDISVDCEQDVRSALEVTNALDAELTLLYVADERRKSIQSPGLSWPDSAMERNNPGCELHRAVVRGPVAQAVSRYADFIDASLIITTTEYRSGLAKLWKRSTTLELLKATGRPLLVLKSRVAERIALRAGMRILCMLSLDGTDGAVLSHALGLAREYDAELVLFAVVPESNEGILLNTLFDDGHPSSVDVANDRLRKISRSLRARNQITVATGSPYSAMRKAIDEQAIDLVVARRSERAVGNVSALESAPLVREIRCPLLSVARAPRLFVERQVDFEARLDLLETLRV